MARVPGATAVYEVADQFRSRCLTTGDSLLWPTDRVWTVDNIAQLREAFKKRVDGPNFYEKLRRQIDDCAVAVHKIAVDVIAFYQLPVAVPTKPETKMAHIQEVVSWRLASDPPDLNALSKAFTEESDHGNRWAPGLMHPGQSYLVRIPWQIAFYLDFARNLVSRGADVSNIDVCSQIAAEVQQQEIWGSRVDCRSGRHILMHLLFPDRFERMASEEHKQNIVDAFKELSGNAADLDDAIFNIRQALERQHPGEWVDFYGHPEIYNKWSSPNGDEQDTDSVLAHIADLLETRALDEADVLNESWWKENVRPITRPFLDRIKAALEPVPTRLSTKGGARKKRSDFDRLHVLLSEHAGEWDYGGPTAFVTVGYHDEPDATPNLERCVVWGFDGCPRSDSGITRQRVGELIPEDLPVRFVDSSRAGPWADDYVLAAKSLTPDQLRQRKTDELVAEIVQDHKAVIEQAGGAGEPPSEPPGDLGLLAEATFLDPSELREIEELLKDKKQIILEGPPGSGKTWVADKFARYFTDNPLHGDLTNGRLEIVQFHQSYGYEDFVQGIRPKTNPKTHNIEYRVEPGLFLRLCEKAREDSRPHVIIIDEINRGNVARVFGELLLLVEYRDQDMSARLTYAEPDEPPFSIPSNVYIIGTMNTTDRSLALIDYALRRRFYFCQLSPVKDGDASVLRGWLEKEGIAEREAVLRLFVRLNEELERQLDEHHQVGHSYFMRKGIGSEEVQQQVWQRAIIPLLEEYFHPRKSRRGLQEEFGIDRLLRERTVSAVERPTEPTELL